MSTTEELVFPRLDFQQSVERREREILIEHHVRTVEDAIEEIHNGYGLGFQASLRLKMAQIRLSELKYPDIESLKERWFSALDWFAADDAASEAEERAKFGAD